MRSQRFNSSCRLWLWYCPTYKKPTISHSVWPGTRRMEKVCSLLTLVSNFLSRHHFLPERLETTVEIKHSGSLGPGSSVMHFTRAHDSTCHLDPYYDLLVIVFISRKVRTTVNHVEVCGRLIAYLLYPQPQRCILYYIYCG